MQQSLKSKRKKKEVKDEGVLVRNGYSFCMYTLMSSEYEKFSKQWWVI